LNRRTLFFTGCVLAVGMGVPFSGASAAIRSFGLADGMAAPTVRAIMEDGSGALWFGASEGGGGVSRYDGAEWQTIHASTGTLHSQAITCMLADRSGALWFGTQNQGLSRYAGGNWTSFTIGDLPSSAVTCLFQDASGRLWVGTSAGVAAYDGSWTRFGSANAPAAVAAIAQDRSGRMWVLGPNSLHRWDGTRWAVYYPSAGIFSQVPTGGLSLRADMRGRIWCGFTDGVAGFDPDGNLADSLTWRIFRDAESVPLDDVNAIELDPSGNVWFGHRNGLSRFDGHLWRDYTSATTGSTILNVTALHLDRSGNLWIGSDSGAQIFDRVTWDLFSNGIPGVGCDDTLEPRGAQAIFQDSTGAIWFGTCGGGVMRLDPSGWAMPIGSLPSAFVSAIAADSSGALWFGTNRGAVRYDGSQWTTFNRASGLPCDTVRALAQGPLGRMWFGTARGLASYDGSSWQSYGVADLISSSVLGLFRDHSGDLWVAGPGGASRFDGVLWSQVPLTNPTTAARVITQDGSGRMWFGTPAGLRVLAGQTWSTYTTTNAALWDNSIGSLLVDRLGVIWVGTAGGISRFDGVNWAKLTDPDGQLAVSSMWEDVAGDLWFGIPHAGFGLSEGAVRHTPDRVPPQTVIAPRPDTLSANTVQTLRYVAGFKETQGITFSFSLDAEQFSPWSPEAFVVASGLRDGTHRFVVKARDALLQEDPSPDTAFFEVDATAPAPVLSTPVFGQPVRDSIAIRGDVDDLRFRSYRILVRPQGASSWNPPDATVLAVGTTPIHGGVLAGWNTRPDPDGYYELRAEVTDVLGLVGSTTNLVQVDNVAPFASQTTPARVSAATGGDVYTLHREVHLYLPPHALQEDATVTIDPLAAGALPGSLPGGARPRSPGYAISWSGLPLAKRVIVDFHLDPPPSPDASLWWHGPGGAWSLVGGTSAADGILSTTVSDSGAYAVFEGVGSVGNGGGVTALSLTPRVLSRSGYAGGQVGIGFVLGRPGRVSVDIYDRAGRQVREIAHDLDLPAGANLLRWDGRGHDGAMVDDGLYLVAVRALGERRLQELAVVR
jgi:ligand-binding sensor domain-containing protein